MTMNDTSSSDLSFFGKLDDILDQYLQMMRKDEAPSVEEYACQFPAFQRDILELLPAIRLAEQTNQQRAPEISNGYEFEGPKMLGVYHLHREIGRGGMGVVYEATQDGFSQRFAIKVLVNHVLPSTTLHTRFVREAESTSRLHHSNIVPSKFYGSQGRYHYLVMPLIDGISLDRLIAHKPENDQDIQSLFDAISNDWRRVSKLGAQIASALHYSHENGIIHRDIKPANLILDRKGNPWVTDFGLAKLFEDDSELSRTGELLGTPRYMSPEQVFGIPDARSDVYSLGLTLYEILVATRADRLPNPDRSEKRSSALEIADLKCVNPKVPRELSEVIMKACAHHPENRYQTAREFEVALNTVCFLGNNDRRAAVLERQRALLSYRQSSSLLVGVALVSFLSYPFLSSSQVSRALPDKPIQTKPHLPSEFVPPPTFCISYEEPGTNLVNVQIAICSRTDDVEEYEKGTMYIDSTDLELTWDETDQVIGLRFSGVEVPKNAKIHSATICFQAVRSDTVSTELTIRGIDDANPPTFNETPFNLSHRTTTELEIPWNPGPWTRDAMYESPSCTEIVQYLVNKSDWKFGNAIAFRIDGNGSRTAASYDGNIHSSARLKIQYVKPETEANLN